MSGAGKRTFTSFVRPAAAHAAQTPTEPAQPDPPPTVHLNSMVREIEADGGEGREVRERTRVVTSTGRVRTYTASRNLPGVTLRMSEARWERLKLLSIQERRPIQEILGEAMADFMRARGLPW
jgi:hypothetical protein